MTDMKLAEQIEDYFGLEVLSLEHIDTTVNDVEMVTTPTGKYALKLYLPASSTREEVEWELALTRHLVEHGAPVVNPVPGKHGYVESFEVDGEQLSGALFEWAPGEKSTAEPSTYVLLGRAAAQIHAAADSFHSPIPRESYDAHKLITEQIERMKPFLIEAGQYEKAVELGERLLVSIGSPSLDWGINHMDLTLDNVHRDGESLTVFDFESSAECWRAYEPYGVLRFSTDFFQDWLEGYRSVRPFDKENERAVQAFAVIGDLRNTAWKLGVARSSRGKPLLTAADLPEIVDCWLELEKAQAS